MHRQIVKNIKGSDLRGSPTLKSFRRKIVIPCPSPLCIKVLKPETLNTKVTFLELLYRLSTGSLSEKKIRGKKSGIEHLLMQLCGQTTE